MSQPIDRLRAALADHYRLDREVGRGGMATVFLAHDPRHDRDVAIKVLHPELTAILGAERFLQEIRVTARLAHPHILPLLDSGEADGFLYYVAPYVEGESLRQRLAVAGSLSMAEAVRITRGVAAALDSAHRRGIIHRDIKPENILLQDGEPLVADFGIALAVSSLGRDRLTETGLSLGTPAYMSPEQATADPRLDGRSDQYSLACVVYEMLAGEPPYTGASAQAIIAKRMTEPLPRLSAVREVPTAVEAALVRGLSRNPADRFAGVGEFAAAIEAAAGTHPTIPTAAATVATHSRSGPSRRMVAVVSAIAALGVVGAMGLYLRPKPAAKAAVQLQLTFSGDANAPAISPDGKWVAFTSGDSVLLVREVSGGPAIRVMSGSYILSPRWSPDGAALLARATLDTGFSTSDGLYEVARLGGEPRRVGAVGTLGADYSPDGKLIASSIFDTITVSDRASGAIVRRFKVPSLGFVWSLRWSPGGRWIAVAGQSPRGFSITMVSPEGQGATAALSEGGAPYAWDARGTSLYLGKSVGSGSELVRIAIDRKSGGQIGPAMTLLSGLPTIRALDVSADGRTLVMSRGGTSNHVWTVALTGPAASQRVEQHQLTSGTRANYHPAVSPDGRWVAWIEREGTVRSILLVPFEGGTTKLIGRYAGSVVEYPAWSPDSRRLGFIVTDSGRARVIVTDREGRQPATVAEVVPGLGPPWAWGPGAVVVWSDADSGFAVVDLKTRERRLLHAPDSTLGMYGPVLSQDGTTLLAARWKPAGSWNDLHTIRLDGGSWMRVTYDVPGDPGPTLWDASGIYVDVTEALGPHRLPARIWRAAQPGRAFVPFLRPLEHCTASTDAPLSLSRDHTRGACTESRATPDLWLVTDFDPEAR